jgi:hypothetical protein
MQRKDAAHEVCERVVPDIRRHPPAAYVSIRQHTSAYVSMRQHPSAHEGCERVVPDIRRHPPKVLVTTSVFVLLY